MVFAIDSIISELEELGFNLELDDLAKVEEIIDKLIRLKVIS